MFTRPADLPDQRVADALAATWGLPVDSIEHAAVGFGSHHWRAFAEGRRWFVTVDEVGPGDERARLEAALTTARMLADVGMAFVVAPVPAPTGRILVPLGDRYAVALYPHVDGEAPSWGPYETPDARLAVLEHLVTLHTAPPPTRSAARRDDFAVTARDRLLEALSADAATWNTGPYGEATRRLLETHEQSIISELDHYDRLVARVRHQAARTVITHGEPHRANTIRTRNGVVLVDWDTALLAPPERDLWSLVEEDGAIVAEYERRTGATVDPTALELYGLRWSLTDLALFASEFHEQHDDTADTRTAFEGLVECVQALER